LLGGRRAGGRARPPSLASGSLRASLAMLRQLASGSLLFSLQNATCFG